MKLELFVELTFLHHPIISAKNYTTHIYPDAELLKARNSVERYSIDATQKYKSAITVKRSEVHCCEYYNHSHSSVFLFVTAIQPNWLIPL